MTVTAITAITARAFPICAVTEVVPDPIPVTSPDEFTTATAGLAAVHAAPERICRGTRPPLLSWTLSASCAVAALAIRSVCGLMISARSWIVTALGALRPAVSVLKALTHRASRAAVAPAAGTVAR